ncbi:MAG TPA: hypothetical protein VNS32_00840 [Flavisolibacter sp.]|nr:hypothetical protein [Flavisolibacter sp.]
MNVIFPQNFDLNEEIRKDNSETNFNTLEESSLMFDDSVFENLPIQLQGILSNIEKGQRRDIGLLSILIVLSNVIRKLFTVYDTRKEGCQLYCYVISDPGPGKGFATKFREVGIKWHNYLVQKIVTTKLPTQIRP